MNTNNGIAMLAAAVLAGVAVYTAPAGQDGQGPNAAQDKTEGHSGNTEAVSMVGEALRLADRARQMESVAMMVSAAELLASVRLREGVLPEQEMSEMEGEGASGTKPSSTTPPSVTPGELLDEAEPWARGDEMMVGLITRARADSAEKSGGDLQTMGAVGGPKVATKKLLARTVVTYEVQFRGGEAAIVIVDGDGDTDLDLFVYDANGHLIDQDIDLTDTCVATWTPRWTGTFTIKVANLGNVWNEFVLTTN